MRTVHSSSCLLGGGVCLSACWDKPRGMGLETPQGVGLKTLWVWVWRPPRCGPENPPRPDPSTSALGVGWRTPAVWACRPLWVWVWRPPRCGPGDPLGVGLETPVGVGLENPPGCGPREPPGQTPQLPPSVWAWRPAMHARIPARPPCGQTDTGKNITFAKNYVCGSKKLACKHSLTRLT